MNTTFKKILYIASLLAAVFMAGCTDDIADEITELNLSRLLSPTDLDVRVVNQTSARLTWKPVQKATSFVVEFHQNGVLDFSGTPVRTVEGVLFSQLPLVVPGFDGETSYSVRVKAIGEDIPESLWISATFTTDAEQIFFPVNPDDITFNSVVLRWPAGETATHILLVPGDIQYDLTADDIADGSAEITGLESETQYTAYLKNGEKTRGTQVFTTLVDTGNAIIVNPSDDLLALIEGASDGDLFALMPGDYIYPGNIEVHASIDIVAAEPANRPVIHGVSFRMFNGAGLRLKDLIMDGFTAPDGNQMIIYNEVLNPGEIYGEVVVEDCVIHTYGKGIMYVNIAVLIESVTFRGNIIHGIQCTGGDFIDYRNGMTRTFDFINNTVYNSAPDRDLFRMDAGGSTNFPTETSILTIRNNTFYNIIGVNNRRILYIRLATHQISVTKNIFAETQANYSNQSATTVTQMADNNYWNAPNLTNPEYIVHDTGNFTTHNPGFVDPANGNFTVTNEELIIYGIGDPRWLP